MAKKQKFLWHDLAIILLIVLVIATNIYWMIVTRDINDRLDKNLE